MEHAASMPLYFGLKYSAMQISSHPNFFIFASKE